jgi:hypothetical protein
MSNEYASAEKRLDCLSRVCLALGTALDGLGRMKQPPADEARELAQQLLFATRQATWLTRISDPYYIPREQNPSPDSP